MISAELKLALETSQDLKPFGGELYMLNLITEQFVEVKNLPYKLYFCYGFVSDGMDSDTNFIQSFNTQDEATEFVAKNLYWWRETHDGHGTWIETIYVQRPNDKTLYYVQ